MKLLITCLSVFFAFHVHAQSDAFDSTEYVFGLPVTNDDTVYRRPADHAPKDILVRIPNSDLPKQLRATLNEDEIFKGWEQRGVFRDKNTDLFIVYIKKNDGTRMYGLNRKGKVVTFNEYSPPRDTID